MAFPLLVIILIGMKVAINFVNLLILILMIPFICVQLGTRMVKLCPKVLVLM